MDASPHRRIVGTAGNGRARQDQEQEQEQEQEHRDCKD